MSFPLQLFNFFPEEQESRFIEASNEEIKNLVSKAVPENTKKSTKYAVNIFEGN